MSLEWRQIAYEALADTPYLRVLREKVTTPTRPDGVEWMVVRRKRAVVVAPRMADGRLILIRQERIPIRAAIWEFPSGQIDGPTTPHAEIETVRRELAEEAGCVAAGSILSLGSYWSSAGFTDECCALYLAEGTAFAETGCVPDPNERILEIQAFEPAKLWALIASGEICDANTLVTVARMVALGYLSR